MLQLSVESLESSLHVQSLKSSASNLHTCLVKPEETTNSVLSRMSPRINTQAHASIVLCLLCLYVFSTEAPSPLVDTWLRCPS